MTSTGTAFLDDGSAGCSSASQISKSSEQLSDRRRAERNCMTISPLKCGQQTQRKRLGVRRESRSSIRRTSQTRPATVQVASRCMRILRPPIYCLAHAAVGTEGALQLITGLCMRTAHKCAYFRSRAGRRSGGWN
eukprot:1705247-Pleurochrysis_carterae.AAC.1